MVLFIIMLINYGTYFRAPFSNVDSNYQWSFEKYRTYFGEKNQGDTLLFRVNPQNILPQNEKYLQSRDSVQTVWLPDSQGGVVAPSKLVYNSSLDRIYIISGGRYAPNIAVCDVQSGNLLSVINLDWRIADIACCETNNKLYCATDERCTVEVVDCLTNQHIATIYLPSATNDLIWSPIENEIYCSQEGTYDVQIIDCTNDSLINGVQTNGYPKQFFYNAISNKIYCYISSGRLAIIDASTHNIIQEILISTGIYVFTINTINNKVYCVNENSDLVTIIDGAGDSLICIESLDQWPICTDFNSVMNRVYFGHLHGGTIYIFDGNTNQHIETLYFNAGVFAMAYDSIDNRLFVVTEPSVIDDFYFDMIILDGTTNAIIDSLKTGILPWNSMIWEDEHNQIWVANQGFDNLPGYTADVFDAGAMEHIVKTAIGFTPYAPILNPITEKYYCVGRSDNFMVAFNTDAPDNCTLKTVGECAWDILLNPLENKIYCANITGRDVSILDGISDSIIARVPVSGEPYGLLLNDIDNKIYVANTHYPQSGYITVVDGVTNMPTDTISVPLYPFSMVWNSAANKLYVSCFGDTTIIIIDAHADTIITSLRVSSEWSLECSPISNKIYCSMENGVGIIDGFSNELITTLYTGIRPFSFTYNSINNKIYSAMGNGIAIIDCATDSIINTILISGFKYSALFNPISNRVFCAYVYPGAYPRPDGMIVIDGETDEVLANFPIDDTQVWAMGWFGGICSPRKALVLDSLNNKVYLNHYFSSRVSVLDGETGVLEQTIIPSPYNIFFRIFPSPASDDIHIELSLPHLCNTQMAIYDVTGRAVKNFNLVSKRYHHMVWDGTDSHGNKLPNGVYFLTCETADFTETKKFILLR